MKTRSKFLPYLKPHRLRFYYAVLAMCVVAVINGGSVLLLKPIVDKVFIARDLRILLLAVIGLPLLVLVKTVASYIQNYMMSWIGQTVTQKIREELFRHLHRLPINFYDQHHFGEIISRVTSDLTMVQSALTTIPLYLIRDAMTVVVLTFSLFYLDWRFALLSLLVIPLSLGALFILSGKMRQSSLQSQALMDRICERFEESARAMLIIKAFNYEDRAMEKFKEENASFFAAIMRYLRATALAAPLMEMAGSLIVALIIYMGGREVISGHMTPGAFFAFLGAFFSAYAPIKNLARSNSELQRALACGERIFQLLDERPRSAAKTGKSPFGGLNSRILFDDVGFHYPDANNKTINRFCLEIAKGDHAALVGPSGAGKTTLLRLLMLLHQPTEGRLLFDGTDAALIDPRSLRARLGLITQQTILFNDTVFGNVAMGSKEATLPQVERACRAAGIADIAAALPRGYETMLGDHGLPLTPSLRQKLALARIAFKDPPVVLLDQATAGLDAADEEEFLRALEAMIRGRTMLFAAHKLHAVPRRYRILVMDNGELIESGDHKSLLAGNGLYRRLYDLERREPAQS